MTEGYKHDGRVTITPDYIIDLLQCKAEVTGDGVGSVFAKFDDGTILGYVIEEDSSEDMSACDMWEELQRFCGKAGCALWEGHLLGSGDRIGIIASGEIDNSDVKSLMLNIMFVLEEVAGDSIPIGSGLLGIRDMKRKMMR